MPNCVLLPPCVRAASLACACAEPEMPARVGAVAALVAEDPVAPRAPLPYSLYGSVLPKQRIHAPDHADTASRTL